MSSQFLSERCANVVSIETSPEWHRIVDGLLLHSGRRNVDLRLRDVGSSASIEDQALFDFVLVDGAVRDAAMETAIRVCRPGGWILFDNSDVQWPEHQRARAALIGAAEHFEVCNDLYPFALQVCESILAQMPSGEAVE